MRGRPVDTLLAALAVLAAAMPLTALIAGSGWLVPAALMIAVVAAVGWLGRWLEFDEWALLAVQFVAVLAGANWIYALGSGPFGLPTTDTPRTVGLLSREAGRTLTNYAAPAPATPGLIFAIGALLALLAILVDDLAVTRRAPALAGYPLLLIFLVSVINTNGSLPWWCFPLAVLPWLALVLRGSGRLLSRWSTTSADPLPGQRAGLTGLQQHALRSRTVAVAAIAIATLAATVLPSLPPRYLFDGLGRGQGGGAGGAGVSLATTVDISRDLGSRDPTPVMRWRTNGTVAPPLLVAVADTFDGEQWTASNDSGDSEPGQSGTLVWPTGINPQLKGTQRTAVFEDNRITAPQIATPVGVLGLTTQGRWRRHFAQNTVSGDRQPSYEATYLDFPLTADLLDNTDTDRDQPWAQPLTDGRYLDTGTVDTELLASTLDTVLNAETRRFGPADSSYQKAMAIQEWLRSDRFTYSLTLVSPTTLPNAAAGERADALTRFLATRQGYCVQFSTAMIMLARQANIPARMGLGFLPGDLGRDGWRTVRAADAHAWPELFIDGVGWTRFEPTPPTRSGSAPSWAVPPVSTASPTASTAPRASTAPAPRPTLEPQEDPSAATPSWWQRTWDGLTSWWTPARALVTSALVLGLLAGAAPSVAAWLVRRRRRRLADSPAAAIEAEWLTVSEQLADLDAPAPAGLSPRGLREHYRSRHLLDDRGRDAMTTMLDTVEQQRYLPPAARPGDADAARSVELGHTIVASARRSRGWRTRLRAMVAPSAGVTALRRLTRFGR